MAGKTAQSSASKVSLKVMGEWNGLPGMVGKCHKLGLFYIHLLEQRHGRPMS